MVCFASFLYQGISGENQAHFIALLQQYFPGVTWKVRRDDMTIETADLKDACARFGTSRPLSFQSGRIYNQLSFLRAFPRSDVSKLAAPAPDLLELAQQLVKTYHDDGAEVAWHLDFDKFPWERLEQVLATFHSIMPLAGYIHDIENGRHRLWLLKEGSDHQMYLFQRDELVSTYTNCVPRIVFDLDDGFVAYSDGLVVPAHLKKAFAAWKARGRTGPIFP